MKWWVESDFKAPNLPLSLRLKVSDIMCLIFYLVHRRLSIVITLQHIDEKVMAFE